MTPTWTSLPTELKLAIVDELDVADARLLSRVDLRTYAVCVPLLFRDVKLSSLDRFLENVPRAYCRHIESLHVEADVASTTRAAALISLLLASPRLNQLVLNLDGAVHKSVIPCFNRLSGLRRLTIRNCAEETLAPLSERVVVSIAASVPNLQFLHLERISRSTLHAPELIGKYPYVPMVRGDEDIEDHPTLGAELSLPSLLALPSLRQLTIRDTHLGDPRWATAPVACRLEVLDLGSCPHEPEAPNRLAIERIMSAVGPSLSSFSLATALADTTTPQAPKRSVALPRLRQLHISPFFPVDAVPETMAALAGSPIESLSVQCFADDVVDACDALQAFLAMRVAKGPSFFDKLTRIDVSVTGEAARQDAEADAAAERLQEFCRELDLSLTTRSKVRRPRTGGDRVRSNSCAF